MLNHVDSSRTVLRNRNVDCNKYLTIFRDVTALNRNEDNDDGVRYSQNGFQTPYSYEDKLEKKAIIEKEVKKAISTYEKKKLIIIPKAESVDKSKNNSNAESGGFSLIDYKQTKFERPASYIVYKESERQIAHTFKEYEASLPDVKFIENNPELGIKVEDLEQIIILLEHDVEGEIIPLERAEYLYSEKFKVDFQSKPERKQHFEKIYKYWTHRRDICKKSLLRKFWREQKSTDKHLLNTFKRREDLEKMKMKTRKKKRNDREGLDKLKEIRESLSGSLMAILTKIKERENIKLLLTKFNHLEFQAETTKTREERIQLDGLYNLYRLNYKKPKVIKSEKQEERERKPVYPIPRIEPSIEKNESVLEDIQNTEVSRKRDKDNPNNWKHRERGDRDPRPKPKPDRNERKKEEQNKEISVKVEVKPHKPEKKRRKLRFTVRRNKENQIVIDRTSEKSLAFYPFDDEYTRTLCYEGKKYSKESDAFEKLCTNYLNSQIIDGNVISDSDDDGKFTTDLRGLAFSFKNYQRNKRVETM